MITFEAIKRKILIVDDDPEFVKMLLFALKDNGYDLSVANNGRMAIEKIRLNLFELVLLDLNLPDMDGREILRRIREINEDIATIVITGYGGQKTAIDLMKAGAVDFISKPFDMEILVQIDRGCPDPSRCQDRRQEIRGSYLLWRNFSPSCS